MFAWVKDYQVPSRTSLTKTKVESRRQYKKELIMKLTKLGENLPNVVMGAFDGTWLSMTLATISTSLEDFLPILSFS